MVNNHHNNSKKNSNQKNTNGKVQTNSKNGNSKSHICEFEDDFYYNDDDISSFPNDFKDYSIKNFKPKAPKKKFNTTAPSNAAASLSKI